MELKTAKSIVTRLNKGLEPNARGRLPVTLYEDYSGRGMFGTKTSAVVLPGYMITDQMRKKYRVDNMGLDMVIY